MNKIETRLAELAANRPIHYALDNVKAAAEALGNPQNELKFIHIAGTNGKGTTADFIAQYLEQAGFKVGLYTSPHLASYTERFRINGQSVSSQRLAHLFEAVSLIAESGVLTEFEILTLMALKYFHDEKVDYVVWETGLGGRLDATNIVTPLLSVITTISWDHQSFLGSTLPAIASEKAGIMKWGVPVVRYEQPAQVAEILDHQAQLLHCPVTIIPQLEMDYLINNQRLAAAAVELVLRRGVAPDKLIPRLHARHQILRREPFVMADAAHNLEGILQLVRYLGEGAQRPLTVVFSATVRPELEAMLNAVSQVADQLVLCEFEHDRAVKLDVLVAATKRINIQKPIDYVKKHNLNKRVNELVAEQKSGMICLTGSIYFLGQIIPPITRSGVLCLKS